MDNQLCREILKNRESAAEKLRIEMKLDLENLIINRTY